VADVFQALAQERPYRPAMHPTEILSILVRLGKENTLSQAVIEQVGQELDTAFLVATKGKMFGA
jgi:HD-GYP domain-containing protein (c-di-GMP phosphodiesterase class II)